MYCPIHGHGIGVLVADNPYGPFKDPIGKPLAQFRARSYEIREPYGVVLVMSPWNYPFLLSLDPAIGAVAAGNCCIIKPSAYAPASSRILKELIGSVFEPGHVTKIMVIN